MTLTLALDQGTHASRAVLFGNDGEQLDMELEDVELHRLTPSCVEQDPTHLHQSLKRCCHKLLSRLPPKHRRNISQCGLATQRSTLVPCSADGMPLGAALSWQDSRGASFVDSLNSHKQLVQDISGLPLSAHYGASKMQWILDSYEGDDLKLAPLSSYLLMQLVNTGNFVVDHGNAQRTQLMALASKDWSTTLLELFDIPIHHLPVCVPVRHDYGELMNLGIPVTAVSGDQNAALFSGGEPENDTAYINIGSGAFVLIPNETPDITHSLLTSIAYSSADQSHYFQEATINGAGTALNWIRKRSDIANWWDQLPLWLDEISNPPIFINSIGGLASPWWRSDVTAEFRNNECSQEGHEAQAVSVAESIVFLIKNNLDVMSKQHNPKQIFISGGVSKLDGLCQKLANLSQLPVHRFKVQESTARGIAWLARADRPHWPRTLDRVFKPTTEPSLLHRYKQFTRYLENL